MIELKEIIREGLPANWLEWYRTWQVKKEFDSYRYAEQDDNLLKSFDQHKILFIHIPKTAGISVRDSLFQTHGFSKHVKAMTYRFYFGEKNFDRYFKFALVRNPWARTLSAYHFLKKGGINTQDKEWSDLVLGNYPDFETFVLKGLAAPEIMNWVHFIPQYKWICDHKNQNLMDFTGRLETLEQDYEVIRQKTGLGRALVHKNKGESVYSYREHYTEAMKEKIEQVYKIDIELFNYDF